MVSYPRTGSRMQRNLNLPRLFSYLRDCLPLDGNLNPKQVELNLTLWYSIQPQWLRDCKPYACRGTVELSLLYPFRGHIDSTYETRRYVSSLGALGFN